MTEETQDANDARQVRVFISHKHDDRDAALLLHRKLSSYGGAGIDCFISEKIPYSADWFEHIRKNLAKTDVLVLLFTLSDTNWDWPLYEVGLATNLSEEERCRVVCIHSPGSSPPDPLQYVQAVPADEDHLTKFLHQFFCTSEITHREPPLNPQLEEGSELRDLAAEIANCFAHVDPWEHCFTNYLWLVCEDVPLEEERVPPQALIDSESTALAMFGLTERPPSRSHWTWEDLLKKLDRPEDEDWIQELGERVYWASRGEVLKSTHATFTSIETGREHRPVVHRVELRTDGSMLFEVIFVETFADDEESAAA